MDRLDPGCALALAQVPANANLDVPAPSSFYEHGSAPFAAGEPSKTHGLWPVSPGHVGSYAQPFAPANTSTYGAGPHPNEGYFFSYERLFWSMNAAQSAVVGSTSASSSGTNIITGDPTLFTNTDSTSFLTSNGGWGNRWEVGYMDDTNYGWMVSVLDHVQQSQYHTTHNTVMQFDDPAHLLDGYALLGPFLVNLGKEPVKFDVVNYQNITTINGVQLERMYRAPRLHKDGYFDVLYGVRWLQMVDYFMIQGQNYFNNPLFDTSTDPTVILIGSSLESYFNPLSDTLVQTRTFNNLIGPQIGLRWFAQRGKFITSVEGRFLAAANFQNTTQRTKVGTLVVPNTVAANIAGGFINPLNFQGISNYTQTHATVFSPAGELRVNLAYTVTSKVSLKVGYTGLIIGDVSRASNRIDYSGPNLFSLLPGRTNQTFWANGLSFGVEVNR